MADVMPHTYGWIPQTPDHNDYLFAVVRPKRVKLPASVDLAPKFPAVYDQGQLGSCTANATCAVLRYDRLKQGLPDWEVSRLAEYYWSRMISGDVRYDGGSSLRDAAKAVAHYGYTQESLWTYDIARFKTKPPAIAVKDAAKRTAIQYLAVQQKASAIKGALAQGYALTFGFTVYESFESDVVAKTGIVPMPALGESSLGGHAVVAVGYDDAKVAYKVRNSWGAAWGLQGYCWMPYAYVEGANASDFWAIESVPA